MSLSQNTPNQTTGHHRELFRQIESAFGTVPNMFKTIGHSSAALEAMWSFFGALGRGAIPAKMGEQIAVYVADLNRCDYCLSAHTVLGQKAGATSAEMSAAQAGESKDPKTQAALQFAGLLVKNRGQVKSSDVDALRTAGFNDAEITEILAHVALNLFTNYTNVAFGVPVDFPKIKLR